MAGKFALRAVAICALALAARAADSGKELLSAARAGDVARITALVSKSPNLEARDKRGKTPLMLAAERGYADAVKLLLAKGASPAARDKSGLTAYGLALFSSQGPARAAVLAALPKPARIRLNLQAAWLPDNLASSCFLAKNELAALVTGIHPDALLLGALAELARTEGRDVVEVVNATSEGLKTGPDAFSTPLGRGGRACNAGGPAGRRLHPRIGQPHDGYRRPRAAHRRGIAGVREDLRGRVEGTAHPAGHECHAVPALVRQVGKIACRLDLLGRAEGADADQLRI